MLLTAAAIASIERRVGAVRGGTGVAAASPAAATAPGMRVVMDPATGEIVGSPTAEHLAREAGGRGRSQRRSARDLRLFELGGGARGVALDGWAHHALRAERDGDGRLRLVCSRGDDHEGER